MTVENIVREGEDAFAWCREEIEKHGPLPCVVRDAGGPCGRAATMEVYGLAFCEVHGAECKAGALEELYHDAEQFLDRLDNPHVAPPNPEALRLIRAGVSEMVNMSWQVVRVGDETLVRAYPFVEELADPQTLGFDYSDPERGSTPEDWYREDRMLTHKLMRLAFEGGASWIVEELEKIRQSTAAQLAYAVQDYERKRAERKAATH